MQLHRKMVLEPRLFEEVEVLGVRSNHMKCRGIGINITTNQETAVQFPYN
jgi:hypothetical protein